MGLGDRGVERVGGNEEERRLGDAQVCGCGSSLRHVVNRWA